LGAILAMGDLVSVAVNIFFFFVHQLGGLQPRVFALLFRHNVIPEPNAISAEGVFSPTV